MKNLIGIDDNPGEAANEEDEDNCDENPGNLLVSGLSGWRSDDSLADDDPVEISIEDNQQDKWDKDHDDKVAKENIILDVEQIRSQFCWTNA